MAAKSSGGDGAEVAAIEPAERLYSAKILGERWCLSQSGIVNLARRHGWRERRVDGAVRWVADDVDVWYRREVKARRGG